MRTELFLEKKVKRKGQKKPDQASTATINSHHSAMYGIGFDTLNYYVSMFREVKPRARRADGDYLVWSEQAKVMIDLSLWSLCRYQTKAYQDEDGFRKFVHDEMLALRQMGTMPCISF